MQENAFSSRKKCKGIKNTQFTIVTSEKEKECYHREEPQMNK